MPIRSANPTAMFLAGLILTFFAAAATPAAAECESKVAETLQELRVPQESVKSIDIVRRSRGGKSSSNYTLDAMVKLNTCSGNVVINMTRYCMVNQTYTTGDCAVGTMSNY